MNDYQKTNQATWNTWTRFHVGSKFDDVKGWKAGKATCP